MNPSLQVSTWLLSVSVHELGILGGKSRRKRYHQQLPAARAIPAVRIMRGCPVSLPEGHSQAKCTDLFSTSITGVSDRDLGATCPCAASFTDGNSHFAARGINTSPHMIFLWQEKGSQTGLLESDPLMVLKQRAGQGQIR